MYRCDKYGKRIRLYAKRVEMGTADMNKKIIKTASVIAVGAGAAALYKAKAAKDNNSGNETQGYGNSKRRNNKCQCNGKSHNEHSDYKNTELGKHEKTVREFIMQAVIMRHLQNLKSLTELRKNPHTLSEADSVHLRQHAFL